MDAPVIPSGHKHPLIRGLRDTMIEKVPSYGNTFLYSLGFLSMISFVVLLVTGVVMVIFGPNWWLTSSVGGYARSVQLWATQAFVLFIIIHLLTVFFTSGFRKPRRLTWVLGVPMLFTVLAETEFGYILRGDFSSQWRSLQGADFYNGAGLGTWVNPLDYGQMYGIHIAMIPMLILLLLGLHYLLVRVLGIAKPYRSDVVAPTVKANHRLLFIRAGVLVIVILGLGLVLPSPSGLYEPALLTTHLGAKQANVATFASRFLSDTGVLEDQATRLNLTTDQYGMVREETGNTPGAWWLSPIGLLNHTVLASDDNGDRDAAIIFGALLLTMLAFPFIPYLNRLPDALKVYTVIWGKEHRAAKRSSR